MTSQSKAQLDESRNAVALLHALHHRDTEKAQAVVELVTDAPAFLRGLEAAACAAFRVIDGSTNLTGITADSLLNHLSAKLAAEEGI